MITASETYQTNRRLLIIYVAFLIFLSWIIFFDVTNLMFDADDQELLGDIEHISSDPSFAFSDQRFMPFRPLSDFVFLCAYLCWGDNAAAYHILLIALHCAASLLIAYTLRNYGYSLHLSLLSSVLFLINVAHFRAIHWITCISYVLTLIWLLLTLVFCLRFLTTRKLRSLIFSLVFFASSIVSHPASAFMAFFFAYLVWQRKHTRNEFSSVSIAYLLTSLVFGALALLFSIASTQLHGISSSPTIAHLSQNLLWFTGRTLTTAHWLITVPNDHIRTIELLIGTAYILSFFLIRKLKIFDWWLWSIIIILPFINHPPPEIRWMPAGPSRQIYFATVGTSVVFAFVIEKISLHVKQRWGPISAQLCLVLMLASITVSSFITLKRCIAISLYTSGRSYIARSQIELGTQQLERALTRDATLVPFDAYLRLATESFAQGMPQTDVFKEGLKQYPEHAQLTLLLGLSMYLDDKILRGQHLVQQAFEKTEDIEQLRSDAGLALQNLAGFYHENENYEKAITFYKEALSYRPHYSIAKFNMANALHEVGRYEDAINTMHQVVDLDPSYKNAILLLGNMLFEQNRFAEAEDTYRHYLTLDHQNAHTHYDLALAQRKQGKFTEAAQTYYKALALTPDDTQIHLQLAEVLYESGNNTSAIDEYQNILEKHPANFKALQNITALLIGQNRTTEAVHLIQSALNSNSTNNEIWYLLAQAHQGQNNLIEIRKALHNAVKHAPENKHYLTSYLNLGVLFQQQHQPDIARAIYSDLVQILPTLPDVHINLGILEFEQAHYSQAIDSFKRAAEYAPNNAEAYLGLAQALEKMGNHQQALSFYRQVLTIDPQNKIAKQAIEQPH